MNQIDIRNVPLLYFNMSLLGLLISCGSAQPKSNSKSDGDGISLFNGKDLKGWYTYQRKPELTSVIKGMDREHGEYERPIGLHKDPLRVFTVVHEDGKPAIRISGEVFGVLVTEQEFENYHLSMEFKWGVKKYPPRKDKKRDSGVLYHSVGKEGVRGGAWMRSVELQVQEGDVGDLWCVDSTTARVRTIQLENKKFQYHPRGEMRSFDMREDRFCQKSEDFEKELGEWNRLDIYAYDRESVHVINGKKNMHLTYIGQIVNGKIQSLTSGKIQIQSEGAEVFYRDITLSPIEKMPDFNQK